MKPRPQRLLAKAQTHASCMLFFIICSIGTIILFAITYQHQSWLGIFATSFASLFCMCSAAHHEAHSRKFMDLYYLSIKRHYTL